MPLTGRQVREKHIAAIRKCVGKTGFDALECIVDSMREEYKPELA